MIDYDLHIHTNFSDGVLTPQQVLEVAALKKLKGISITDHDTVDAIKICENLSHTYGIDFIPGVELSTEYKGSEIHMLGYYIDYNNNELLEVLNVLQSQRFDRLNKMIDKINKLGYEISLVDVLELAGSDYNSLGRPHLARTLIKKGYFESMPEVFNKLLGAGMPGYVERFKFNVEDAIKTIKKFGGVPVLAHPGLIRNIDYKLEVLIDELVTYGLEGIEVYHTDQTNETSSFLTKMAYKHNLVITGGSDYHAPSPSRQLSIGSKGVLNFEVEKLKKVAFKHAPKLGGHRG